MPLYEYKCKKCGHRFEKILKFSDKPIKKCPDCGGPVEQMLSAPAVQFKGAGWYVTDYAKKDTTSSSTSSDGDGSAKESSKEAKDSRDSKGAKKDDKPKAETHSKKHKKD